MNKNIILYSNHCPKCMILERKLKNKGIKYKEVNDIELMKEKGFMSMPMLEIDGEIMNFNTANHWITNEIGENKCISISN